MPLIRPSLGPVSAAGAYGWRKLPNEPPTWHDGLDFVGAYGSPIRAVKAGTVVAAAPNGTYNRYGNVVIIKHDDASDGVPYSLYAHLSSMRVRKGQRVAAGRIIGGMGNLAATKMEPWRTVRTHLHFEIPSRFPLPPPDTGRIDPTPHIALAQRSVSAPAPAPTPVYSATAPAPALYSQQAPLLYSQTSPMLSGLGGSLGAAQSLNPLWYYLAGGAVAWMLLGRARDRMSISGFDGPSDLCSRMKEKRLAAGLTQPQLAARLGVSPRSVSRWETGEECPSTEAVVDRIHDFMQESARGRVTLRCDVSSGGLGRFSRRYT